MAQTTAESSEIIDECIVDNSDRLAVKVVLGLCGGENDKRCINSGSQVGWVKIKNKDLLQQSPRVVHNVVPGIFGK